MANPLLNPTQEQAPTVPLGGNNPLFRTSPQVGTGKPDLTTPEGLRALGASKGISLPKQKEGSGVFGGVGKVLDVLRTGEFAVGGLISGEGIREGVRQKISPSDVVFGTQQPESTIGKILFGAAKLATDVVLDPTTYLTLGAGAAIKVGVRGGAKIALSKTGKELLNNLATEIVEKSGGTLARREAIQISKEQVAKLASPETATLLERGGLSNIRKALEKSGIPVTRSTVETVLKEGVGGLRIKTGLKFAGKELVSAETLKKPFSFIDETLKKSESGRELVEGVEKIGSAIARTLNRDFGLLKRFIEVKQKFLDSFDNSVGRVKNDIKTTFAGTTKLDRRAIAHAIEGGPQATQKLPENLRPLAQRTKQIFQNIAKEEESRGLLDSTLEDYITHLYKNRERARTLVGDIRKGQPSALLRFAKERKIPTLEEAKGLGLDPVEDIAEILNIRLIASEKAKLTQDFYKNVALEFGVSAKKALEEAIKEGKEAGSRVFIKQIKETNPELARRALETGENFVRLGDVGTGVPKRFREVFIPSNIADDIGKMGKRFFDDEDVNLLLRGWDKAQNFFKGSVTVVFPSFHGRNAISNVMLNFLDIGLNALRPSRHKLALDILTGKEGKLITELGEEFTFAEVRRLAREHQVFQDVLRRTDIGRILERNALKRKGVVGIGQEVGRGIENEGRMLNFTSNLIRGFDPTDAAARTKKFLFDYDNLSDAEKAVARRMIPFYTFTRKNLALQLRTVFTDPGKIAQQAKAIGALEDMFGKVATEEEKKFAPEWVKQGLGILLDRKGDDRTFLIGFDLPFEDAFEKLNKPLKSALSLLTPFLKVPLEAATGRNFFTEKNIKDDDSGNFADNLPASVQEWLEYNVQHVKTKDGREFDVKKVNPQKKWIFQNTATLTGAGRLSSQRNLNQLESFWKMLKGDKITLEERFDMVSFFIGIRTITRSLEAEKKRQQKEEKRELEDVLERRGVIGTFEKTFIPKEQK